MQILARTVSYTLLCCILAAAAILVTVWGAPDDRDPAAAAELAVSEPVTVTMSVPVVVHQEAPPAAPSSQILLVFHAGGATYVKLADVGEDGGEAMPRHGAPMMSEEDYVTSAIAKVDEANVPRAHRRWLGMQVTVDATCTAKVTGFAVVARLTGYPSYAGEDGETWTARLALDKGAKVLAAKLDNCAGGTYAREASLAPIIVPQELDDAPLAARATRALIATPEVKAAQREWAQAEQTGTWYQVDGATTQTRVVRLPTTGATFVSVHLYMGGACGLPNLSVWGLYRAGADGELTRVKSSLGEFVEIQKLVDVDGDGELEVIGRPWLGTERAVQRTDGSGLAQLAVPFYMCPC